MIRFFDLIWGRIATNAKNFVVVNPHLWFDCLFVCLLFGFVCGVGRQLLKRARGSKDDDTRSHATPLAPRNTEGGGRVAAARLPRLASVLAGKLRCQRGHVLALEPRALQLHLRRQPRAVSPSDRRRAVRRQALDRLQPELALERPGQPRHNQPVVQEEVVDRAKRRLLAAVLRRRRHHRAAHLADQRAAEPQLPRLVEERLHLRGHAAEARRRHHHDRVVPGQLVRGHRRHAGERLLRLHRVHLLQHLLRQRLRDPAQVRRRSRAQGALHRSLRHQVVVTVRAVERDEDLGHCL
mmetsp:Transcript_60087/g.69607  ORF Transcript_60087/g.69607 Transcript_60087/m.69607 type:complete len:295 (+) Transcript_60087:1011-1895(+)